MRGLIDPHVFSYQRSREHGSNMSTVMKRNDEEQKENERIHKLLKLLNSLATRIPVISLRRADDAFTILRTYTVSVTFSLSS